jgi:pyrimidine deaminase RibD-like protein
MFMDKIGRVMKLRLIGFVFIFLIYGFNVHATTACNTKLTKQNRYDDLNKTLQCLSSKIQKLEQRIGAQNDQATIPASVGKAAVDNSKVPANYSYRDENFLVTLKKCTKKGKDINCIVKYENISGANVSIMVLDDPTYMVDEDGERWSYKSNSAIIGYNTEITNKTYLTTKFIFDAQGGTVGSVFSLFIRHRLNNRDEFKITFNDVYLN